MNERSLYSPLIKGAYSEGWILYHIRDGTDGLKPFDIGGFSPTGLGVALEVKSVDSWNFSKPIPWSEFRQHQVAWLTASAKIGAVSLVAIYNKKLHRMVLIRLRSTHEFDTKIDDLSHVFLQRSGGNFVGWHSLKR